MTSIKELLRRKVESLSNDWWDDFYNVEGWIDREDLTREVIEPLLEFVEAAETFMQLAHEGAIGESKAFNNLDLKLCKLKSTLGGDDGR